MRTVLIDREPVELYKILKFEGLVGSGAEAKQLIAEGYVLVNAEVETRKRRKMLAGDVVAIDDIEMVLELDSSARVVPASSIWPTKSKD